MENIVSPSPFGERTQKYWDLRHTFFFKWDAGIQTDEHGLYSVKPEIFALETAELLQGECVLDAFCGIGGSAIAFARKGKQVIAVDIDEKRLRMAARNAGIYGVADRITFIHGDVFALYQTLSYDALNLDPPWGGPDYTRIAEFHWFDFAPNPWGLIQNAIEQGIAVAISLPMNFASADMAALPPGTHITEARTETRALFKTAYVPPRAKGAA